MMDAKRRAVLTIALVAVGCGVMAWVEGALRPIYPVKSALKIAVFLGCAGLYVLFSRDFGPLQAFRRPRQIKLTALLAAGVLVFLLGGYLLLSPWLDLSAIPENLAAKEGITRETFPLAACTGQGGKNWPGASPPWPSPCTMSPSPAIGGRPVLLSSWWPG